ncbi:PadR family transcriptional regulator [Kouleothrix sp.]|uniref:PadR family transcriptional regulator n=1 Tax=Kouleothrix sp. TaxID=2779161 RepID=UPI00391A42EA
MYTNTLVYRILRKLDGTPKHGYDIILSLFNDSNRMSRFIHPFTLYYTIDKMLNDGVIEEVSDNANLKNNENHRRYYQITYRGRQIMLEEIRRQQSTNIH